jgi:hypothetical protein
MIAQPLILFAKDATSANLIQGIVTGGVEPITVDWYRRAGNGRNDIPVLVDPNAAVHTSNGLTPNTTYYFSVRYTDANGLTVTTAELAVTTESE